MNRNNSEKFIVFIDTLASVGVIIETFLMGWEFWFPAIIVLGVVVLWAVNLSEKVDQDIRRMVYFGYAALILFYKSYAFRVQNLCFLRVKPMLSRCKTYAFAAQVLFN